MKWMDKRKLRAKKWNPREDILNIRIVSGVNVYETLIKNSNIFQIELIKPTTKNFLLTGTLTMGTVIKKICIPCKIIGAYNAYKDHIQIKNDGDDVVFTGYLIEFYDPPFDGKTRSEYGKGSDLLSKIKEYEVKNCYVPKRKNCFAKWYRVFTGRNSYKEYFECLNDYDRRIVMNKAEIQSLCKKSRQRYWLFPRERYAYIM